MGDVLHAVDEEIKRLTTALLQQQREDRFWHFLFPLSQLPVHLAAASAEPL